MTGFLIVLHTIISVLLITVVLMQASQGGGLSGTFGGNAASSMLGGQNAGNVLSRITTWLATLFLTLAVLISVLTSKSDSSASSLVKDAAEGRENILPTESALIDEEATLNLEAE
tara:strand:- start:53 stop:397 length:345 start_codon:yes stop_codon:yes gene_type:complete